MSEILASPAKDFDGDDRWMDLHLRFVNETREKDAEILFIGDTILAGVQNLETWNEFFIPFHCLNFSIADDTIANVLWRLQNGELDHIAPKVIILHVGTTDIVRTEPDQVLAGVRQLLHVIRAKQPDAFILIPTLLPRGKNPNALRDKINRFNCALTQLPIDGNCEVIRIDEDLVSGDGTISHYDLYDYYRLTNAGCRRTFTPLYDRLIDLLNIGDSNAAPVATPTTPIVAASASDN